MIPSDTYSDVQLTGDRSSDQPEGTGGPNRTGDPQELARQAEASEAEFLNLQEHLNNSLDTPGTRGADRIRSSK